MSARHVSDSFQAGKLPDGRDQGMRLKKYEEFRFHDFCSIYVVLNNANARGNSLTGVGTVRWFKVQHGADPGVVQERTRDVALGEDGYREAGQQHPCRKA